jgi:SAM-dependent methyltransferase
VDLEDAFRSYASYFNDKIKSHGATPQGVDYNGPEAQVVRFEQLVKVIDGREPFHIIDFGCGYGALLTFMQQMEWRFSYQGYDMLASMIRAAREHHRNATNAQFTDDDSRLRPSDYVLAGAIFNNKFGAHTDTWREHILNVLRQINGLSKLGFAFNMLSSYSDPSRMKLRPDLYFADPLYYFDLCKRQFSRDVALLHDYGQFDFTILVRKGQ